MEQLKSNVEVVKKLATAWKLTSFTGQDKNPNFVSTFNSAVNSEILNQNNVAAATKLVIKDGKFIKTVVPDQDPTLYENETKANEALKLAVVEKLTGNAGQGDRIVAAAAYGITGLETALAATTNPATAPYTYIWNGCKLDEVMEVVRLTDLQSWNTILKAGWADQSGSAYETMDLKVWMKAVLNASNADDNGYVAKAKEVVNKYIMEYQDWQYSQSQIAAAGK